MSWETLNEFKQNTGIKLPDSVLQQALDVAVEQMKSYIFIPRRYQSTQAKTVHQLTLQNIPQTAMTSQGQTTPNYLYIADLSADRVVDVNDLNIFELQPDFTEIDRKANVTNFNVKYGVLTFDISLPSATGNYLIIEYAEAKKYLSDMLYMLKELNELIAVNWVFQKVPAEKLQSGIDEWTINGVTVRFNNQVMNDVMESNRKRIRELYNLLIPTYTIFNDLQAPRATAYAQPGGLRNFGFTRSTV